MAAPLSGEPDAEPAGTRAEAGARRRVALLALGAVLAAATWAVASLAGAAGFGYTNNGDFSKYNRSFVAGPAGDHPARLASPEEWREAFHERGWHRYWLLRDGGEAPRAVPGTGATPWLWAPGLALHRMLRPGPTLDLTWLGLLPRLLVLAGVVAVAAVVARCAVERRAPLLLLAIVPWTLLFTASSTTAYFNTFYRETGTFVFALFFVCSLAAAARLPRLASVVSVLVTGALLVASAPAHAALALVVALCVLDVGRRAGPRTAPTPIAAVALALAFVATIALGIWRATAIESHVRQAAVFNSLFLGLLPHSDRPAQHLERLGLPPDALRMVGVFAFRPEARAWRAKHGSELAHRGLVGVVLREPRLVPRLVVHATSLVNHTSIRDRNLWADDDDEPRGTPGWNAWGEFQARWLPTGAGYLVFLVVAVATGLVVRKRAQGTTAAVGRLLAACAVASGLELALKYAAVGPTGEWRLLVACNFFLGACAAALVWLGLLAIAARRAQPLAR